MNNCVKVRWAPRSLTSVIPFRDDCPIDDEVIFPVLRHARRYARKLIKKFGDENGWISNMRFGPEDSFFANDNLNIKIMIMSRTVQWPNRVRPHHPLEAQIRKMQQWIKNMEGNIQTEGGDCPECDQWLDDSTHKEDCELAIMLVAMNEVEKTKK